MLRTTITKIKKVCSLVNITRGTRIDSISRVGKFQKLAHTHVRGKSTHNDGKHPKTIIEFGFRGNKSDRKRQIDTFEKDYSINDIQKRTLPRFVNIMDKGFRSEKDCKMCNTIIRKIFRQFPDEGPKQTTTEVNQISHCKEIGDKAGDKNAMQGLPSKILNTIAQANMINGKMGDNDKQNSEPKDTITGKDKNVMLLSNEKQSAVVNTSTEKRPEDIFGQKIEQIDEPTAVGDQEIGFNVTPQSLQDKASILDFAVESELPPKQLTPEELKEISLDELAKRCVNFPDEELDERLLKEMDKFTICLNKPPSGEAATHFDNIHKREKKHFDEQRPVAQPCSEQTSNVPVNGTPTESSNYQNYLDPSYFMHNQYFQNRFCQCPFCQNYCNRIEQTFVEQNPYKEIPMKPTAVDEKSVDKTLKETTSLIQKPKQSTALVQKAPLEQTVLVQNVVDVKRQDKGENPANIMDKLYPTCEHFVTNKNTDESVLQYEKISIYDKSDLKSKSSKVMMDALNTEGPKVQGSTVFMDIYINKKHGGGNKENEDCKKEPIGLGKILEFEHLNPNYVVTCNETCPISADGLTDVKHKENSLKGTEVIYDDKYKLPVKEKIKLKTNDKTQENSERVTELEGEGIVTSRYPDKKLPNVHTNYSKDIDSVSNLLQHGSAANIVSAQNAKIKLKPEVRNNTDTLTDDCKEKDTDPTTLSLNDSEAPLSELLRRVRERNRREYCNSLPLSQATVIAPEMGKCRKPPTQCPPAPSNCPKPAPKCPPPAPKCPTPAPRTPSPCPPPSPACPKPCRPCPPPKQDPCSPCKFQKCDSKNYGPNIILRNPEKDFEQFPRLPNNNKQFLNDNLTEHVSVKTIVSDVILQKREAIYRWMAELFGGSIFRISQINGRFVRDYDPWTPIPSWPIPKKVVKRPLVCPKHGCKIFPPVRHTPPCVPQHKPCKGFPRRICSESLLWEMD